jgi:CRP/FNR family transcriptional regulator, anaerobic regulatory protein
MSDSGPVAVTPCRACPLRKKSAFAANTEEEIDFIQSFKTDEFVLPAQAKLIREGTKTGELYTLLDGWAFRFRTLSSGGRQILNFLLPGDFIGMQQKVNTDSSFGVELLTEGRFCKFPAERIWDVYKQQPTLAYDITWIAANEELIVDENLVSVGRRSAMQRVGMLLIHLFKRAESVGMRAEDGSVPFPVTQQHMADALGLSLVHMNRTLQSLKASGAFRMNAGRLAIDRPDALNRMSDYFTLPLRGRPLI